MSTFVAKRNRSQVQLPLIFTGIALIKLAIPSTIEILDTKRLSWPLSANMYLSVGRAKSETRFASVDGIILLLVVLLARQAAADCFPHYPSFSDVYCCSGDSLTFDTDEATMCSGGKCLSGSKTLDLGYAQFQFRKLIVAYGTQVRRDRRM